MSSLEYDVGLQDCLTTISSTRNPPASEVGRGPLDVAVAQTPYHHRTQYRQHMFGWTISYELMGICGRRNVPIGGRLE